MHNMYDYSNDKTIKKLFVLKSDKTLNIIWSLNNYKRTSRIKQVYKLDDKRVQFITESGSVYITRKPEIFEIYPAFTKNDFK